MEGFKVLFCYTLGQLSQRWFGVLTIFKVASIESTALCLAANEAMLFEF